MMVLNGDFDENYFEELEWLREYTPCFQINSSDITVLRDPDEFYRSLKGLFSDAQTRILVSALYLGTGKLEQELVNTIEKTMQEKKELKVKMLFDYSRGLRGVKNSNTMLQPLLRLSENRFRLFLYHSPNLRGIVKKILPQRADETIGVMHMKIYISDNKLIISGANLSHDYFTNRQDRYIQISNCKQLCDFFESVIDSLGQFSFQALANGECVYLNQNNSQHPFNGVIDDFTNALGDQLKKILIEYKELNSDINHTKNRSDAFVYPLLQINDCDIHIEELITEKLFKCAPISSYIHLAVGYFNLTNNYIDFIVKHSAANFKILLSSPEANGFYGSTGFSKNIPSIYSYIEEEFFNYFTNLNQDKRISLHEYKREKWTYHAKGLWYSSTTEKLPSFTIIGSSNYGYRSMYRDVEAQILIKSKDESLQKQIDQERKSLYEHANFVTKEMLSNQSRALPKWLKLFTKAFRSFF